MSQCFIDDLFMQVKIFCGPVGLLFYHRRTSVDVLCEFSSLLFRFSYLLVKWFMVFHKNFAHILKFSHEQLGV